MNTLIVYCHPSKESYTYQILSQLKKVLKNDNISFEISDLYEMEFQSDMTIQEYKREGLLNLELPIPKDVQQEHKKIKKAHCIIFLYPVWWSDCPAKLKGWFDRVYSVGYAYGHDKSKQESQKMKPIKYGLSVCTAGHSNSFLKEIGIAESMRNVMLDDRLGQRFINKEMMILGGTSDRAKVEKKHSEIVESISKQITKYCG